MGKDQNSFKRPSDGKTTLSAIIKDMEDKEIITSSTRNLERKFAIFVSRFGGKTSEWKDENGHYSIEIENKAILEAFIIELDQKDGYTDKLLGDKREDVDPDDVFRFFNNCAKYIEGKVSEDVKNFYLSGLDEDIGYSLFASLSNIHNTIEVTMLNIQGLPYIKQLYIMKELEDKVAKVWKKAADKKLKWSIDEEKRVGDREKTQRETEG